MVVSRGTTPARHGSPMRGTTPGRGMIPGGTFEDMRSTSKNAMANESRPRLLGGMATFLNLAKTKAKSTKGAVQVPQSNHNTRQNTNKLPGKPDRLIEEVILSTPKKKKTTKVPTKKRTEKKVATPKVIKPRASKVTKKKAPAKPLAKNATVKKAAATIKEQKAVAAKASATALSPTATTKPSPNPRGRPKKSLEQASTSNSDANRRSIHTDSAHTQPGPFPPLSPVIGHSNDQPQVAYGAERIDAQEAEGEENEGEGEEVKKGKGKERPKTGAGVQKTAPKKKSSTTTNKKATAATKASQKKTGSAAVAAGKK